MPRRTNKFLIFFFFKEFIEQCFIYKKETIRELVSTNYNTCSPSSEQKIEIYYLRVVNKVVQVIK